LTRRRLIISLLGLVLLIVGYVAYRLSPLDAGAAVLHFDYSEQEAEPISWFSYDAAYLGQLRSEYRLDELVKDCTTDYERVQTITDWVHNLWKHDGSNQPAQNDPLFILREVEKGQRFRCVEYGVVISGCLQSLGMQARTLGLKTEDVETRASGAGHVATEVFLPDLMKWVFLDGQWNATVELEGQPLNAVEFQAALVDRPGDLRFPKLTAADALLYKKWITPYLYYFDVWTDTGRLMLGPQGAPQPTKFQVSMQLNVHNYTHAVNLFYAVPQLP